MQVYVVIGAPGAQKSTVGSEGTEAGEGRERTRGAGVSLHSLL